MKKDRQRLTKVKPFINKYKWEGTNIPSGKDDWKKIDKNNVAIVLNVLYAKKKRNKLESHKKVCENKQFCNVIMSSEDIKILEFNQYQKADKAPSIIYADLECMIERTDECKNNPENFCTTKVSELIPSGFSMSTITLLRSIENKNDKHVGKNYMKKFYEFLREHAMKIINSKKNQIKLLIK